MKRNSRVYLCGPISSDPDYKSTFARYEQKWRAIGHELVISPATLHGDLKEKASHLTPAEIWLECMIRDIAVMVPYADGLALLPGAFESQGSRIEIFIAMALKKTIYDADTLEEMHMSLDYCISPFEVSIIEKTVVTTG